MKTKKYRYKKTRQQMMMKAMRSEIDLDKFKGKKSIFILKNTKLYLNIIQRILGLI